MLLFTFAVLCSNIYELLIKKNKQYNKDNYVNYLVDTCRHTAYLL